MNSKEHPRRLRRCALYTRKSSEEGLEQGFNSLDAQREACAAYVASQRSEGWKALPERYDDGGFSGGSMERPALKRLMADIAAGRIDVVVVYKIDRLTRSLADFARMVEAFERHEVSFVSVTQSFNTTSSMGRLTLNVLLSFAQFEREVTGERIRDKIAASKRKGMWMGGTIPLGYDRPMGATRTLVVNEAEAITVRMLFARYLALGSVHALERELADGNIRTKVSPRRDGGSRGGVAFSRGALFHLLRNRLYRGEIVHKGQCHPGLHPAIVDADLFDAVQSKLASQTRRNRVSGDGASGGRALYAGAAHGGAAYDGELRGGASPNGASTTGASHGGVAHSPLTGRIFDADGQPMSPAFAYGRSGRLYRYHVSAPLQQGHKARPDDPHPRRVAARIVEAALVEALSGHGEHSDISPLDRIERLRVLADRLVVTLTREAAIGPGAADGSRRSNEVDAEAGQIEARPREIIIPFRSPTRGGRTQVLPGDRTGPRRDPFLIRALRKAHTMVGRNSHGQPTLDAAPDMMRTRRILRLAFLAPDLQRAILDGRQPRDLTLAHLLDSEIPMLWSQQRKLFGTIP